jgi:hypothetical protein
MAKFTAWELDTEAKMIAEKLIEKYPQLFRHIDVEKICFVRILNKKSTIPTKVEGVKFPASIYCNNVYFVNVYNDCWATLETAHRNLAIAQALYSIHVNGFEESSNKYGKLVKPDVVTFLEISCMAGNIPNWLNNASVSNPLDVE